MKKHGRAVLQGTSGREVFQTRKQRRNQGNKIFFPDDNNYSTVLYSQFQSGQTYILSLYTREKWQLFTLFQGKTHEIFTLFQELSSNCSKTRDV